MSQSATPIRKIIFKLLAGKWMKNNPRPEWKKGKVYGPTWDYSEEYKLYCHRREQYRIALLKHLGAQINTF